MKKLIIIGLGVCFAVFLSIFLLNTKKTNKNQVRPISPRRLSDGLFLLSPTTGDILAQSQQFKIDKSQYAKDPVLQSLKEQKKHLALIEALQQFVIPSKKQNPSVQVYTSLNQGQLQALLNQYGLPKKLLQGLQISSPQPEQILTVDGSSHSFSEIKRNHFMWGVFETKIFERYLDLLKKDISNRGLTAAAQKQDLNTQDFIEKYILKGRPQKSYDTEQVLDFLKKNYLQLPIKLNLTYPDFKVDFKPDWTPHLGAKTSIKKILFFADYHSDFTVQLLENLNHFSQKYPDIYFGLRPLFPPQDTLQQMLAELSFCVWAQHPNLYWDFLRQAMGLDKNNYEQNLYRVVSHVGLPLPEMKACLYEKKYHNVVEYHQQYADYMQIKSGPIIFFNGLVYANAISMDHLDQMLEDSHN